MKDRNSLLIGQLLEVWEDSVKATHLFLSNEEIKNIKEYVPQAISGVSHLVIIENESHQPIAFMGIEDRKLEMLFIKNSERGKGLESIIGNIYQSFGGQDIYKAQKKKDANFLYLIVKNHVFTDGNKRIAATLFIYFLNFYDILYKNGEQTIDNNTLAALTLLIAESNPKEKEIMIDLVMNFLNND